MSASAAPPAAGHFTAERSRLVCRLGAPGQLAAVVITVVALAAIFAPVLALHSPNQGSLADRWLPVASPGHVLGTDGQGRDILSRLLYGARMTLLAGVSPVVISTVLGTAIGVLAGMRGGWLRSLLMRPLDVLLAFPGVILALSVAAALGAGLRGIIVSLTIIGVAPVARVAEGEAARVSGQDWLLVARTSGASTAELAYRHVLPNVLPAVVAYATAMVGASIAGASGLGFIGLGVQPPTAEWGAMIQDLQPHIYQSPLLALTPVLCVLVISTAFAVLGDSIGDALRRGQERA